jgi:hypothetical protein
MPMAVPDGSGGVIWVWQNDRLHVGETDLYGQRLTANGEALWDNTGRPLAAAQDIYGDPVYLGELAMQSDRQRYQLRPGLDYRWWQRHGDHGGPCHDLRSSEQHQCLGAVHWHRSQPVLRRRCGNCRSANAGVEQFFVFSCPWPSGRLSAAVWHVHEMICDYALA